jgi:hypothetical protein
MARLKRRIPFAHMDNRAKPVATLGSSGFAGILLATLAGAGGGDGIMIDPESIVAPADKAKARDVALTLLCQPAQPDVVRLLRTHGPRAVEGRHDLLGLHEALDDALIARDLRPGGTADLLGRPWFLVRLPTLNGDFPRIELQIEPSTQLVGIDRRARSSPSTCLGKIFNGDEESHG